MNLRSSLSSPRQLFHRQCHSLKMRLAKWPGKYLCHLYDRGKGPATRLLRVFTAPHAPSRPAHRLLLPSTAIPWAEPKLFVPSGGADMVLSRMKTDGGRETCPAGILRADRVDVSFPIGMHWWEGRLFEEAFLNSNALTNPKYILDLQRIRFSRKQRLEEGILLTMPWHHNFYHWLTEILPRLTLVEMAGDLSHLPLFVPELSPGYVKASLVLCGVLDRVRFVPNGVYRAERLHIPTRLALGCDMAPAAVEWLRRSMPKAAQAAKRRLYISRADARIRFVANEAELQPLLAEHGFETVNMSDYSLEEQIRLFREAEFVIGSHGAAFAHLVFMERGGTFVELFEQGFFNRCYHRIASLLELDYGFLVGEKKGLGFSIDPVELRGVLERSRKP